jgi:hypothetical protein
VNRATRAGEIDARDQFIDAAYQPAMQGRFALAPERDERSGCGVQNNTFSQFL